MQSIIYKLEDGKIAFLMPAPEAMAQWGILAIAHKDVPEGTPFKIVNNEDVPADLDSWVVDDSEFTDGVGAPGQSFPDPLAETIEEPVAAPPAPADVPAAPDPLNE